MKEQQPKQDTIETSRRDLLRFASLTTLGAGLSHAVGQAGP